MEEIKINRKKLESYLRFSYLGENMTFDDEELPSVATLSFDIGEEKTKQEYLAQLHNILNDIFEEEKKHCDASFLSSGVDSSLIAYGINARKTFSVAYDNEEFNENDLAMKTAENIGSEHHVVKIGPADYLGTVSEAIKVRGLPTGDASYIALYIAAKEAEKYTESVCSGEGPDELFCGYHFCSLFYEYIDDKDFWIKDHSIMDIGDVNIPGLSDYDGDRFLQMNAFDLTWWMNGSIIPNVVKAAEGTGLDIRMPYMSDRLWDYALSLPVKYKANKDMGKILFREAASKYVGDEIAFRRKKGFPVPVRKWMRLEYWKKEIMDTLTGEVARNTLGFIDINQILHTFYEDMDETVWKKIWEMYIFVIWYKQKYSK